MDEPNLEIPKFETYGFDSFIGKEVGKKGFVIINLNGSGSVGVFRLERILHFMCNDVREGKKVLLSKSPGRRGLRHEQVGNVEDIVRKVETRDESMRIRSRWELLESQEYETLSPEELQYLERIYESKTDMKGYPNPFLYQPGNPNL